MVNILTKHQSVFHKVLSLLKANYSQHKQITQQKASHSQLNKQLHSESKSTHLCSIYSQ